MRKSSLALLLAASAAFAAPPAGQAPKKAADQGTEKPDLLTVCKADIKSPKVLIEHGFHWMKDPVAAQRLSGKLGSYLACAAKAERKDPCKALDAMSSVYKFEKEMGTMQAQCKNMDRYVSFYQEMMNEPKKSRRWPACYTYLDGLASPMKIFDINAVAPRSADPGDPTSDGKFWYVCQYLAAGMRAKQTSFCTDPRVKYYLDPHIDQGFWSMVCASASKLWVKGDEGFCKIIPHQEDGICGMWADFTRAYQGRDPSICPARSPANGLCLAAVSADPKQACSSLWDQLQGDFCAERAKVKLEDLPQKPGAAKETKQP